MTRNIYMGRKISEIIDLSKDRNPYDHNFGKCSCLRAFVTASLRIKFEDGTIQDFCSLCREDILEGRNTPEEILVKLSLDRTIKKELEFDEFFESESSI